MATTTSSSSSSQDAMQVKPTGEHQFLDNMLRGILDRERDVGRIYTDSVGVPTMGIGKALAVRAGKGPAGRNQYRLLNKPEVEALVREGTGNPAYTMPTSEYALLRQAVAQTNAGNVNGASRLIPAYGGPNEPAANNRFGFALTGAGMRSIARKDIAKARNEALGVFRREAQALGWTPAEIRAYEADLATSPQMQALTSMRFNGVSAPKATRAMLKGDAPEAYFEIAYKSNGGQSRSPGIAARRLEEGKVFLDGHVPSTPQEKAAWRQFHARNAADIQAYEKAFPGAFQRHGGALSAFGKAGPARFPALDPVPTPAGPDGGGRGDSADADAADPAAVAAGTEPDGEPAVAGTEPVGLAGEAAGAEPAEDPAGRAGAGAALTAALGVSDGEPEALYKTAEDLTEAEVRDVMASPAYRAPGHPDRARSQTLVREWFGLTYGDEPAARDATGRLVDPAPKRPVPTDPKPARAADGTALAEAIGRVAGVAAAKADAPGLAPATKALQRGLNGLGRLAGLDGRARPTPPLKDDGVPGPKTRRALRAALTGPGPASVETGVALASFAPSVAEASRTGEAPGLGAAARASFADLFPRPAPGRRDRPEGLAVQMAVNDVGRRAGAFDAPGFAPLVEDGWIGPRTERAFGRVARAAGPWAIVESLAETFGFGA